MMARNVASNVEAGKIGGRGKVIVGGTEGFVTRGG